jgi:hypothetical protein
MVDRIFLDNLAGDRFLTIGFWQLAFDNWFLTIGFWQLAFGNWLLTIGF